VLTATAMPVMPFTSDPTSASFFKPDTDYHSLFGPPLRVQVDLEPTQSSIFTATKTTNRAVYDAARSRTGVPPLSPAVISDSSSPSDVLLYNSQNMITETSIYNVAFYRSQRWLTPPVSTGCLPGVLRRWLLEQGRIFEADENLLTRDSIVQGECVLLVNGVQGCQLGKIELGGQ
jgi:4-amino-4-deoxychorismate lyase